MTEPRLVDGQRVLMLCTGNICRSPFAEYWLRREASARGIVIHIESAGTCALVGYTATDEGVMVAREMDVDLTPHRARQLTVGMIAGVDLVLTMEQGHADTIQLELRSLAAANHPSVEILGVRDPYSQGMEVYRLRFAEIAAALDKMLKRRP